MTKNKLKEILESFKSSSVITNITDAAEKQRAITMLKDLEKSLSTETKKDEKANSKYETEISLLQKNNETLKALEKENSELKEQVEEAAPMLAEKKLKDQQEKYKDIVDPAVLSDAMKLIDLDEKDNDATIKTKLTELVKNKPLLNLGPKEKDPTLIPPKLDDPHHPPTPKSGDQKTSPATQTISNPAINAIFGDGNLG